MSTTFCIHVLALCLVTAVCHAEPPRQRLRFPGPANNKPLPILARQEAAPYPPAGAKPEPPFDLPNEDAANYSPDQTYGPPNETYGPPDETYGPPDETYGPPEQTYSPPDQTYGPPDQTYGPPAQAYGPPAQAYGPPEDNNALPQTASIIDPRAFFPQTHLTLPHAERLRLFRPRRPIALRRPQPQPKPAKLKRPTPPRPAKLVVSVGTRPQQGFAQLPPHIRKPVFAGNRIIAYSERLQSW